MRDLRLLLCLLLPLCLLACRKPTTLILTLDGIGLGGSEVAASIRLQFFDPGGGEPFDELVLTSNKIEGVQDGETFTIQITPPENNFDVEVAVGAFSFSEELLGAGRSGVISITFEQASSGSVALIKPDCGDGFFNEELEICDDAGTPGGCPDLCQDDLCGDGLVNNLLEECDLGEARNGSVGRGCAQDCKLDASLVFGGRLSATANAPGRVVVLPNGINQKPNAASLDLNGGVEIFSLTGIQKTPIGSALASLQTTQRISAVATADLSQDSFPELLLLDTLANELHVFENTNGSIAGPPSILALQDPLTAQNVIASDLAVLSQEALPDVLVMVVQKELWLLTPALDGSLDLANLSRITLANTGTRLLLANLEGDATSEIIVSEGAEIEIFTSAGVLLRALSCSDDGGTASLVDLDLMPLVPPALLATRSDGRLCMFQLGAADVELKLFATTNAVSSAVLRGDNQLEVVVGQGDSPIGALFTLTSLEAPAQIETIALSGGTGQLSGFDLDGDLLDDLLSTSVPASAITMFLHTEAKALDLPRAVPNVGAIQTITSVDLDNNNNIDIAAVSPSQTLIFSDLGGTSSPLFFPGVSEPTTVRIIDQNFDTFPDIAIPNRIDHSITVLRGDGQGGLLDTLVIPIGEPFGPIDLLVGNLDNIVGLDWAVLYDDTSTPALNDGGLLLYMNVASTATLGAPNNNIDFDVLGLSKLEAKDLDFDFLREIVLNTTEGNRTDWLTIGDSKPESTAIVLGLGCAPIASIPAELSEDGTTDIVIFCGESEDIHYQDAPALSPPPALVTTKFSGGRLRTATVGDINGDSHLDLLAASPEGSVTLALGKGDGKFTDSFLIPGSQAISSMLVLTTLNTENLFMSDDVAGLLLYWSVAP
jgi:hypothetical protein